MSPNSKRNAAATALGEAIGSPSSLTSPTSPTLILGADDRSDENKTEAELSSPPGSPRSASRKLEQRQRRRSVSLERDHKIQRQPKPIPYPAGAAAWISQADFERLDHPAKRMVSAFAAAKQAFALGKAAYRERWAWDKGNAPLRNWGQRGTMGAPASRSDEEFFGSQASIEKAFKNGTMTQYFDNAFAEIKQSGADDKAILKLAKQADHVLNLACDTLRAVTRRADVSPAQLIVAWEAVTEQKPSDFQKGILQAYYPPEKRLAVSVFVAASVDLMKCVVEGVSSNGTVGITMDDMLKTFYYVGCHLFGYTPSELAEAITAKTIIDMKLKDLSGEELDALKTKLLHSATLTMIGRSGTLFNLLAKDDLRFGNPKKS